jgi:hypothetical protein
MLCRQRFHSILGLLQACARLFTMDSNCFDLLPLLEQSDEFVFKSSVDRLRRQFLSGFQSLHGIFGFRQTGPGSFPVDFNRLDLLSFGQKRVQLLEICWIDWHDYPFAQMTAWHLGGLVDRLPVYQRDYILLGKLSSGV